MTHYIFISPHLDDVVFSCGGYLRQLINSGNRVIVTTVITADDSSGLPLSWLGNRILRGWGSGDGQIFSLRCAEDSNALGRLGAEIIHLGFLDCIYRRDNDQKPLYNRRVINVPLHAHDLNVFKPALENKLKSVLSQFPAHNSRVVCPLTIGGHVDHLLVRQAVEAVTPAPQRVYYEEYPYLLRNEKIGMKLMEFQPVIVRLEPENITARLDASACYLSQIPGLFPTTLEISREIIGAYLPALGALFPAPPTLSQSVQRMDQITRACIQKMGGERYWIHKTHGSLV